MSLCEKVLELFGWPVKEPIIAQETSAPDNSPIPTGALTCPRCGGILVEVSANILRCCQDGFQTIAPARRPTLPPMIRKRAAHKRNIAFATGHVLWRARKNKSTKFFHRARTSRTPLNESRPAGNRA